MYQYELRGPKGSFWVQISSYLVFISLIPILLGKITRLPFCLDALTSMFLTELNRYNNESRKERASKASLIRENRDVPSGPKAPLESTSTLAAVVGYREEPGLFARALNSYKTCPSLKFLLVGVDGDDAEDMEMIEVFKECYPEKSKTLHLTWPLGEMASSVVDGERRKSLESGQPENLDAWYELALVRCVQFVRHLLDKEDIMFSGPTGISQLCISQKHLHKKGIMFTTFIFSIVVADILGIEYMWSSDSDSIILPNTLPDTIAVVAADPAVGGASSGLIVHNVEETWITQICSVVYWCELYIMRSPTSAISCSDCQSGPSTAFRIAALPQILMPWYMQRAWGHRMIVNEDRHLTTNLLLRDWKVIFVSDVLTMTDTPTTLLRWLRQQVRWARAGHIESYQQPHIYLICGPIFLWSALKRQLGPMVVVSAACSYLFFNTILYRFSIYDVVLRFIVFTLYNFLRNPDKDVKAIWVPFAILFYTVPLPAIQLWSLLTIVEDGWGTTMRSGKEMRKASNESQRTRWFEAGWFVVWMGIIGGVLGRWITNRLSLDVFSTAAVICSCMISTSVPFYRQLVMLP